MSGFGKRGQQTPAGQSAAFTPKPAAAASGGATLYAVGAGVILAAAVGGFFLTRMALAPGQAGSAPSAAAAVPGPAASGVTPAVAVQPMKLEAVADAAACRKEINAIYMDRKNWGPWRTSGTAKISDNSLPFTLDFAPPGTEHLTMKALSDGTFEFIRRLDPNPYTTGSLDFWEKTKGKWQHEPMGGGSFGFLRYLADVFADLDPARTKCLGPTNVGGRPLLAYRGEPEVVPDEPPFQTTIYVDPATRRPVSFEAYRKVEGWRAKVKANITYDPTIVITLPAKPEK